MLKISNNYKGLIPLFIQNADYYFIFAVIEITLSKSRLK